MTALMTSNEKEEFDISKLILCLVQSRNQVPTNLICATKILDHFPKLFFKALQAVS
jgi:hypothetical protein